MEWTTVDWGNIPGEAVEDEEEVASERAREGGAAAEKAVHATSGAEES